MTDPTPLDAAAAAMAATPEDDSARLAFYARLAAAELCLLLEAEPQDDAIAPRVMETGEGNFVLAFDGEERLADFAGGAAPYAALPGRALAPMLAEAGLGLGLNLDAGEAATLLPAAAMGWLTETLAGAPEAAEARPERLVPPRGAPEALVRALDAALARAGGLARTAWLAEACHGDGTTGLILGVADTAPGAERPLAQALQEAVTFADTGVRLDITFVGADEPLAERLAQVGLRFDLPEPPKRPAPAVPGGDPAKPPRLR